jgi:hypothetical protein
MKTARGRSGNFFLPSGLARGLGVLVYLLKSFLSYTLTRTFLATPDGVEVPSARLIARSRRCNLAAMSEVSYAAQRRSERKPAQIAVTLVIEGDEADQIGCALDLSRHGVRLQTDVSLTQGQLVGLFLCESPDYVLGARVVWVGKGDSGQAGQAGLELLKQLAAPV